MKTKTTILVIVSLMLMGMPLVAQAGTITQFDTMVAVSGPFIGYPIRGIHGADAAWMLGGAQGFLDVDGRLVIQVEGLVLKETGMNPVETLYGFVSCLKKEVDEMTGEARVATKNITSVGFPADMEGNAMLDTMVMLPKACVAPILFVGAIKDGMKIWFAVSGGKAAMEEMEEVEEPEMEEPEEVEVEEPEVEIEEPEVEVEKEVK